MQTTPTLSNNKIIALVAFVCAALMTSVFVYHISQRPHITTATLSQDIGIVFPVPHELNTFELVTANNAKFSEKNLYQHWTLLFFGFTHCSSVCPTTLDLMKRVYTQLHEKVPTLQVALISVDPERDTPESLEHYVHSYNPNFIGVTGKIENLRKLQSTLGIYAARDNSATAENYQVQHTASILLINPQGKWVGLFKFGLTPAQMVQGIEASIA